MLNYQLRLTDTNGIPVADGAKNIKISFYDAASGGTRIATDCGTVGTPVARKVIFTNGVGTVLIGDTGASGTTNCSDSSAPNAIASTLFNADLVYLGITVESDAEMTPRKRIVASAYSLNADRLDDLETSSTGGTNAFVPVTDASGNFTLSANVTVDTNTLFVDSANNRVGVGTATPSYQLHVLSSAGTILAAESTSTSAGTLIRAQNNSGNALDINMLASSQSGTGGALQADTGLITTNPGVLNIQSLKATSPSIGLYTSTTTGNGGVERARIGDVEFVVNDASNNYDFRVETDANANGIFLDASAETIDLVGGSGSTGCTIDASGNLTCSGTVSGSSSTTLQVSYDNDANGDDVTITTNATDGDIVFAGDQDFRVTTTGNSIFDTDTLVVDSANNRVAIGNVTPEGALHVTAPNVGTQITLLERLTTNTNVQNSAAAVRLTTTGDMTDGFGPVFVFRIQDNAAVSNDIAWIGGVRDGADNSGALNFSTYVTGTANERMRISAAGNVGIGDTTPDALLDVTGTAASDGIFVDNTAATGDPVVGFRLSDVAQFTMGVDDSTTNDDFVISDGNTLGTNNRLVIDGSTGNATITANLAVNGNTTIGDAAGDTVTVNGAAWTFANDTTVALTGGVNGINFDSNTLSIDATNNRIGLGTAAPTQQLDLVASTVTPFRITSSATDAAIFFDSTASTDYTVGIANAGAGAPLGSFYVYDTGAGVARLLIASGGNVGIGTGLTAATTKLQVDGGSDAGLTGGTGYFLIGAESGLNMVFDNNEIIARSAGAESVLHFNADGGEVVIHNNQAAGSEVSFEDTGAIGIGTISPLDRLTVTTGDIGLTEGGVITPFGGIGRYENYVVRSEEFDNASWTKESTIALTSDQTGPDGVANSAERVSTAGAAAANGVTQAASGAPATASTTWTGSVWLKMSTGSATVNLRVSSGNETGTLFAAAADTTWRRYKVTQTFSGSSTGTATFRIETGTNANVVMWGGQLEQQSSLGAYARTTDTAITTARRGFASNGDSTFAGHVFPASDDTYDLGSNTLRWRDLYLGPATLHIGTATGDEGTLTYNTSTNVLGIDSTGTVEILGGSGSTGCTIDASGNFACSGTVTGGGGSAFVNGGNSFGAAAILGTNDTNSLSFETNNVTYLTIANGGGFTLPVDTDWTLTGGVNGLSFDGTTFSVDATNNRIGIGTAAPNKQLEISGTGFLAGGTADLRVTGTGTIGAGIDFNATGTGGRQFSIGATANGAIQGGGRLVFYDVTANANRMLIDSSGNVGIGESSPSALLSLGSGLLNQKLLVYQNGNTKSGFGTPLNDFRIFTDSGSVMTFGQVSTGDGTTYSERMRIDAAGNVGIGETSPAALFTVGSGDDFQVSSVGAISTTIAAAANAVGLTVTQNDTTNNPRAASLVNAGTGNTLFVDPNGNASTSTSVGGAILLENTGNTGAGMVIYSNNATATGRLLSIRADNTGFATQPLYVENDGTSHGVAIVHNSTSSAANGLSVVSTNPNDTAVGISGQETGRGTLKVTHVYTGTADTNAAAISLLLDGTSAGTAAQGIFLDSTASQPTSGKLLNLRNNGTEYLSLMSNGLLGLSRSTPLEMLHVNGNVRLGLAPTTLTTVTDSPLTSGATTVNVADTTNYPSAGTLLIENEAMTYTGVTGTSFTGVTRGAFGTTAASHANGSSVNNFLQTSLASSGATPRMAVTGAGYVGINAAAPANPLHVVNPVTNGPVPFKAEYVTGGSSSQQTVATIFTDSIGDMTDGFGPFIEFKIEDTADVENQLGLIGFTRDGGDNNGKFRVFVDNGGAPRADAFAIAYGDANGPLVGVGTATPDTIFNVQAGSILTEPLVHINNTDTGDSALQFSIVGDAYAMGIDNSDADTFKISYSSTAGAAVLGTNDRLAIDSAGNVGIGDSSPDALLDVAGSFQNDGNAVIGDAATDTLTLNAELVSHILPDVDDTYDLGSNAQRWRDLYLGPATLHIGTTTGDEGTLTYNTTTNTLSIDATGTVDINGGSGSTGCTIDASGNFTCSGTVSGSGTGDITAVGSMLAGDVFADANADDDWLGLGVAAGRIEFDDQATDEVNILDANVGIGDATPTALLTVGSGDLFQVNASGAIAAVVGITSAGGTVSLNANSNFAVNVATGTSTGAVSIGGNANTVAIDSNDWDITTAGNMTGIGTIALNGTITQTGATGYSTGTGAISLNGATTVAAGVGLTHTAGTGVLVWNHSPAVNTAATSANFALTTPVDTNGTTVRNGVLVTPVIGNATTAAGNTANFLATAAVTGDAEVNLNAVNIGALTGTAATERAIVVGSGWDAGLVVNGVTIVDGAGVIAGSAISADSLDFDDLEDTLDLDAALTLNQGALTWTQNFSPAADTSSAGLTYALTTPADTTGTNTHRGIFIDPVIGNATGGTNTTNLVDIDAVTGDAEMALNAINVGALTGTAATENAILVGSGWDCTFKVGSTCVVDGSGNVAVPGTLFTLAATSGSNSAISQGGTATFTAGTNMTTTGNGSGAVTIATVANPTFSTSVTTPLVTNSGADLALSTTTSGNITATPAAASGLMNVLSGNLKVGDAAPTNALDGEDAYVEGGFEVDGSSRLDGATAINGALTTGSTTAFAAGSNVSKASGAGTFSFSTSTATSGIVLTNTGATTTTNIGISLTSSASTGRGVGITANSLSSGIANLIQSSAAFSGDLINLSATGAATGNAINITSTSATATAKAINIDLDNGDVNNDVIVLTTDEATTSGTAADTVKFRVRASGEVLSDVGFTAGTASTNYRDGSLTRTDAGNFAIDTTTGVLQLNVVNDQAVTTGTGLFTASGDMTINGGDLNTNQTTFNLIDSTATTLNIGGASTTLNLAGGSGSTGCTIDGSGNLTCSGTLSGTIPWNNLNNPTGNLSLTMGANTTSFSVTQTADPGTTVTAFDYPFSVPADTAGTNTHQLISVTPTFGNSTAGTNRTNIVNIAAFTGDAQMPVTGLSVGTITTGSTTDHAIDIGSNWDSALRVAGTAIVSGTGSVTLPAGQTLTITTTSSLSKTSGTGTFTWLTTGTGSPFTVTADSVSTTAAGAFPISVDGLTSGKGLFLESTGTAFSSGTLLGVTKSGASGSTAFTGDITNVAYSQTFNGGVALDSTGNVFDVSRSITLNNAGNTHTISGALATFSDSGTQTAGTLASTADVVQVAQTYSANSGTALNVTTAGTGLALRVNDDGTLTDSTPVVVTDAGRFGVGTTTPGTGIAVVGASSEGWIRASDGTINMELQHSGSTGYVGTSSAHSVGIITGNSTRVTIAHPSGDVTMTGDLAVNGGDVTTTSATGNLFSTNATTVNVGDAATTFNIAGGSGSTGCTVDGSGNLTCSGTITSGGGQAFVQNGNSFGAAGTLGTNDAFDLSLETAGVSRLTIGSDAQITYVPDTATDLFNVTVGNVKIGDAAVSLALDGEDLFVEGTIEADGAVRFDNTLNANGVVNLGDGGDTAAVNSSDWDISTTGAMTGITGITNDSTYSQTTNTLTTGTAMAVSSTSTNISSGGLLSLTKTGASGSTAYTGTIANVAYSHTFNAGTGVTHSGGVFSASRNITLNSAGNTHNVTGAVATFSDSGTQTAGTLNNSANILSVSQNYASATGDVVNIQNSGTGNDIAGHNSTWRFTKNGQLRIDPATTGSYFDLNLETEWTGGNLINADFASATTQTTDAVGALLDFQTNFTGAEDQDFTGINVRGPALTQSTAALTTNYRAYNVSATGAMTQNATSGTVDWRGLNVQMPQMISGTGSTGTFESYGVVVTPGGTTISGVTPRVVGFMFNGGVNGGTVVGLDLNATGAGGVDNAIEIASGWDTDIVFEDTAPRMTIANTGNLSIRDDAGNALVTITDGGTTGTLTVSGLTATRNVCTTTGGLLTVSCTSAAISASVTDETGSGALVFGTSPAITTSLTTASASFDLINTAATTVNFAGAATSLTMGATTGTATINNATVTLANATALNVNGASPSIVTSSTGTASVFDTNAATVNVGGAATTLNLAGGSGFTGCTIDGSGNLNCSGAIQSNGSAAFVQNGNSFGAAATLGTNDAFDLNFESQGTTRMSLTSAGVHSYASATSISKPSGTGTIDFQTTTATGGITLSNNGTTTSGNNGISISSSVSTGNGIVFTTNSLSSGNANRFQSSAAFSGDLMQLSSTGASTGAILDILSSNASATAKAINIDVDNGNVNNVVFQLTSDETSTSGTAADTVKFRIDASGEAFSDKGFTAGGASTKYYDGSIDSSGALTINTTNNQAVTFGAGNATFDTNTLFVDATNNRIGIGETTPENMLSVDGTVFFDGSTIHGGTGSAILTVDGASGTDIVEFRDFSAVSRFVLESDGRVGISDSTPDGFLDVEGQTSNVDAVSIRHDTLATPASGLRVETTTTNLDTSADLVDITQTSVFAGADTNTGALLEIHRNITATAGATTNAGAMVLMQSDLTQSGGTFTDSSDLVQINANFTGNTGDALEVTYAGTGFALRVNDASGDTTPFVIDDDGDIGVGTTSIASTALVHFANSEWATDDILITGTTGDNTGPSISLNNSAGTTGEKWDLIATGVFAAANPGSLGFWNDTDGAYRLVLDAGGSVGIGETGTPDGKLHVTKGSAGSVTANGNSIAVFENSTNGYLTILTPAANEQGILFGDPTDSISGALIVDTGNNMIFRTGGNSTKMTLDTDGDLIINPNAVATFDADLMVSSSSTTQATLAIGPGTISNEFDSMIKMCEDSDCSFSFDLFYDGSTNAMNFQSYAGTVTATFPRDGGTIDFATQLQINLASANSFALCHATNGATNDQTITDCSATPSADYAEMYPTASDVGMGDIIIPGSAAVTTTNGSVLRQMVKSAQKYQSTVIGVISNPAEMTDFNVIGYNVAESDHPLPVALNGRVRTKVSGENGPIQPGDPITASSVAGVGMKATRPGMIVGYALDSWTGVGQGMILVFVNPGFNAAGAITTDSVDTILAGKFIFNADSPAAAMMPLVNSSTASFRGSAWQNSSVGAVSRDISMTNVVTGKSTYKLSITNDAAEEIAYFGEDGDFAISGRLFPSDRGQLQTSKYIYYDGSNGSGGNRMRTNAAGWGTGSFDFAEMFPSDDTLEAGELVMVDTRSSTKMRRAVGGREDAPAYLLAGIVSTEPGYLAGMNEVGQYPIALEGRVPTRVVGQVKIGDPITVSLTDGVGVAATEPSYIVGLALEAKDTAGPGTVTVFVKPGWWNGSGVVETNTEASQLPPSPQLGFMTSNLDMSGYAITTVGAISGINDLWSIDGNGVFKTRETYATDIQTDSGPVTTHSTQSQKVELTASGNGQLADGVAVITFDESFRNVISGGTPLKVIVTLTSGEAAGVYVTDKSLQGFTVRELGSGTSEATFDWIVIARRRGFDDPVVEPPPATEPPPAAPETPTDPVQPPPETDDPPASGEPAPSDPATAPPDQPVDGETVPDATEPPIVE